MKEIIVVVIISAIPASLSYLANSSLVFDRLVQCGVIGDAIDVPLIQDYCLWIGIAISAIGLSANLIYQKVKCDCILEQRNLLIRMLKNIFAGSLAFILQFSKILSNEHACCEELGTLL